MIINWISYPVDLIKNSLMTLFLSHRFQIYQQLSSLPSNNIESTHFSPSELQHAWPKPLSSLTYTQAPLSTDTLNTANSPLVFYHLVMIQRLCMIWSLATFMSPSPPTFPSSLSDPATLSNFLSQMHYLSPAICITVIPLPGTSLPQISFVQMSPLLKGFHNHNHKVNVAFFFIIIYILCCLFCFSPPLQPE